MLQSELSSTRVEKHRVNSRSVLIPEVSLLEGDFPFEYISDIAEVESWRKEVYRPIYHMHKWWAQRLGSVFRGLLLGAVNDSNSDIRDQFTLPARSAYHPVVVFDPFMGSGTTVGEAAKLEMRPIGRDINPVAYFGVRSFLMKIDTDELMKEFVTLEQEVGAEILALYESADSKGRPCSVLYYFWVKVIKCPKCKNDVDLFGNYIFARHAYPKKYPKAHCVCPGCGEVNETRFDAKAVDCRKCNNRFDPSNAAAKGQKCICGSCDTELQIAKIAKAAGTPPRHRMYAKLVLTLDGTKEYLSVTEKDLALYESIKKKIKSIKNPFPLDALEHGYNTNQAINYGYTHWNQFFNERQLLAINLLSSAIDKVPNQKIRDLFFCLLSGALEFNNMFASYKGEGTGAVRHMFSHHILKPERVPLEANLWGTPKSSGSFSTLFKSRILRALEYKKNPTEISGKVKIDVKSSGFDKNIVYNSKAFFQDSNSVYISCGDSSKTDIPRGSVDLVLTDPPFFDNVNYSELADFFYSWQKHFGVHKEQQASTRTCHEVQHRDHEEFSTRLEGVFKECYRVLKEEGLLVFSYHHSRDEGWSSVAQAVWNSGFVFTSAFPIKAEMSVATPKSAARDPIDLDIILVCRKEFGISPLLRKQMEADPFHHAKTQIKRMSVRRKLSKNDQKIIFMGRALVSASCHSELGARLATFKDFTSKLGSIPNEDHIMALGV